MKRLLRALVLGCTIVAPLASISLSPVSAATAPARPDSYKSEELDTAIGDYVAEIAKRAGPVARRQQRALTAEQDGDNLARLKRWAAAADAYQIAIANGTGTPQLWLKLAQAQSAAGQDRAQVSAYKAYKDATEAAEKAAALRIVAREFDRHDSQKEALAVYNVSLALAADPAAAERAAQLRKLVAFRITKVDISAESDQPEACLLFNEKLSARRDVTFGAYVRTTPANQALITARDDRLCLEGLKHGTEYQVEVLPGLPSDTGETLTDPIRTRVTVPDRKGTVAFAGSGYVLPSATASGLPVTTVNMDRVALKLLKVNDRNLAPSIDAEKLTLSFSQSDVQQVIDHSGSLVWSGEMTVKPQPNKAVTTAIPLAQMIKDKSPGLYLMVASRPGLSDNDLYGSDSYGLFATNWVLISDLAITTYTGLDGMTVSVRSLASARPLSDVAVKLYARNNGELAAAKTDGDGLARLPAGALNGSGGNEPIALLAYAVPNAGPVSVPAPAVPPQEGGLLVPKPAPNEAKAAEPKNDNNQARQNTDVAPAAQAPDTAQPQPETKSESTGTSEPATQASDDKAPAREQAAEAKPGSDAMVVAETPALPKAARPTSADFNFLDLSRPVFDLSDRGVEGLPAPGPVDAFAYTERGIYRPGETVNLVALVRDSQAHALPDLPVFIKILRPDGVLFAQRRLAPKSGDAATGGGFHEPIALPRDARMGQWTVEVHVDPKAASVGSTSFRVEDFVPPQLAVELSAPNTPLIQGKPLSIDIAGRYYYGAPASDLPVEGDITVAAASNPFPDWKGYQFGIDGEEVSPTRKDLEADPTDSEGRSHVDVDLADLPPATRPLAGTIRIAIMEPSGRAVNGVITRPISRPLSIGLKLRGDSVDEGQKAGFDVVALGDKGQRIAAPNLTFSLIREEYGWRWYSDGGSWTYKRTERDRPVEGGKVPVTNTTAGSLERMLPSGRYRLEVVDAQSNTISSLRFGVGWWASAATADSNDVPDKLAVSVDKGAYKAGETVTLRIKPPFAGEAQVAVANDRVLSIRTVTVPAEGTSIQLPVEAGWGSGAYALVSVYKAGVPGAQRGPSRAVGVAWMGVDSAPRTLQLSLDAPQVARPRTTVNANVTLANMAGGEAAWVTVAAVDEAVLRLTDFQPPAPQAHYYGKHVLGVGLRDIYGRLIDPTAGSVGDIRQGGDERGRRAVAGLPDPSVKVANVFSGIVRLDASGKAQIPLALPDFQGELHLMAVAWTADKLGSGEGKIVVRDPLVSTVSLPRFLATGDSGALNIQLNNLEGAAGSYHAVLTADGAVTLARPYDRTISLQAKGRTSDTVRLQGVANGKGHVRLAITGPNDLSIVRDWDIGVRPPQAYETRRLIGRLNPGESLTLDDGAADQYVPGTGELLATLSPRPDWDVPGLLRSLDRYPYGCIEQTTSRAFPLLFVDEVARLWQADTQQISREANRPLLADTKSVLDGAVERIIQKQKDDGSFGLWTSLDSASPWVNAYVMDFLIQAKARGVNVPDFAFEQATRWLHDYVRQGPDKPTDLPALAYAYYDLARLKRIDVGDVRRFLDDKLGQLQTPLARIQLAAAAAQFGDVRRTQQAFAASLQNTRRADDISYFDDGSTLRDLAGIASFGGADFFDKKRLPPLIDDIAQRFSRAQYLSTQEQAWLLMAAQAAAAGSNGRMSVSTNGAAAESRAQPLNLRRVLGDKAAPMTLRNGGDGPIWRTVSISGVPRGDLPATSSGFTITRDFFRLDGTKADLSNLRQSDLLVAVIKGKRTGNDPAIRQTLVVDLLPAGLEIETATMSKGRSTSDLSWLGELTETTQIEARDDRFIAAFDSAPGPKTDFTLAYIARAVTPGDFRVPATVIEDMYRPDLTGRTSMGKMVVKAR